MKIFIVFSIFAFTYGVIGNVVSNANPLPYESIFIFGDSYSDTGNAAKFVPFLTKSSPYGSTYFNHPVGRMSDGRLIIDFLATAYGLPTMPAYLNLTKGQDIKHGVNFAFAGAPALDMEYFIKKGSDRPASNVSLSVQLDWFKNLKSSLCKNKEECDNYFKKSLFIVGEIGANDVNVFVPQKNIRGIEEIIPLIIEAITNTTTALIKEGAIELAIPGIFPIGCNSVVLAMVNSDNNDDYDQFGCLKIYNILMEDYNNQLQKAIKTLRQENPQAKIIYFDYYNAAKRLFESPTKYGFYSSNNKETFNVCCGGGELYNFDVSMFCGSPASTLCSDPSKYMNWDGPHYTEAVYKLIAKGLIEGHFADPPLKSPPFIIA